MPPRIKKSALRAICVAAAGVWVDERAPKETIEYVYVDNKWVSVTICYDYNGHEHQTTPRRRATDAEIVERLKRYVEEADYLAPETDEKQRRAATAKRLEDLTSDRSIDA